MFIIIILPMQVILLTNNNYEKKYFWYLNIKIFNWKNYWCNNILCYVQCVGKVLTNLLNDLFKLIVRFIPTTILNSVEDFFNYNLIINNDIVQDLYI